MSYLLFLDESGHQGKESPYYVLAGICIKDCDLWNFVCETHDAEIRFFGTRLTSGDLELKGKKLLKKKTFRHAQYETGIPHSERTSLALSCLKKGNEAELNQVESVATRRELSALAQAKLAFVEHLLLLCEKYKMKVFASIVDADAPPSRSDLLRKDYSFLFERYYHFLCIEHSEKQGIVVFDELERSQCHLLVDQMECYFRESHKGKTRSSRIIPEPFFVHSHLTTAVQMADIIAYITSFGVRLRGMQKESRKELDGFVKQVMRLRYKYSLQDTDGQERSQWSFKYIEDFRPKKEQREDFLKSIRKTKKGNARKQSLHERV